MYHESPKTFEQCRCHDKLELTETLVETCVMNQMIKARREKGILLKRNDSKCISRLTMVSLLLRSAMDVLCTAMVSSKKKGQVVGKMCTTSVAFTN